MSRVVVIATCGKVRAVFQVSGFGDLNGTQWKQKEEHRKCFSIDAISGHRDIGDNKRQQKIEAQSEAQYLACRVA